MKNRIRQKGGYRKLDKKLLLQAAKYSFWAGVLLGCAYIWFVK